MDRTVSASGREKYGGITRSVVAQCLAIAVWAVMYTAGSSVWVAASAATLAAVVTVVRFRGQDALTLVTTFARHPLGRAPSRGVVRDFPQPSGRPVGLCWDAPYVTAVVEVVPPVGRITRVGRDRADTDVTLPLDAVAACLRRHDVILDGIDVVMHGWRVRDSTPAGQAYAQLVGPLPATAERTVWLAVRVDASTCPDPIARRGGGTEGAARTVVAAARRVVRALGDGACTGRLLTAREIEAASLRVAHGVASTEFERHRRHVPLPVGFNTGGTFDPRRFDRAAATGVWTHPTLSSTLTVRLRPGDHGAVQVGALARFTTRSSDVPLPNGLRSVRGLDRESLTAALPVAVPRLEHVMPLRDARPGELDDLALPAGGCGQLIGSDDAGRAVTVRLTGPGIRAVYVAGELYLAQQLVFRAVAVGARILLYTDRVDAWRPLLDAAAGPDRLRIAGEHAGDREFDTVVYDGVRPTTIPPQVGTIHVHSHPDGWPRERPTVTLLQPGASGDRVVLTTAGVRTPLTLVTIGAETTHIGRPRIARSVPVPAR